MKEVLSFLQSPTNLVVVLIVLLLFTVALLVFQSIRIRYVHRRLNRLFSKNDGTDIQEYLQRLLAQMEEWHSIQKDQQFSISRIQQKVSAQAGNIAVMRYNAFGDTGSDLSFSVAFLDENQNGVVLTSIYGREESRTYAKPIEQGKSVYNLSDEELAVIKKASSSSK